MNNVVIRNFEKKDMVLLGQFYNSVTSQGKVIFWWVGEEHNWENVFCAFENDKMIAKGQVEIISEIPSGLSSGTKHSIYLNLKTLPEREDDVELLDRIYKHLVIRANELKKCLSREYQTKLCVGNYSSEEKNNNYFLNTKGFSYFENSFLMERDLNQPISIHELDDVHLHFEHWPMLTVEEEKQYLEIESEIWPDKPLGLQRLRVNKKNQLWKSMIVREGETIVGCVMVWKDQDDMGVIEELFVRKNWRNRGIAKYLLTQALTYLKNNEIPIVELMVDTTNRSALSLYQSVGFQIVEEEVRYFIDL